MKNILTTILIVISLNCFAQDTTKLTDSTKFLSLADINRLASKYQDQVSYKQYTDFLTLMNLIIKDAVAEWNKQHSQTEKPKK